MPQASSASAPPIVLLFAKKNYFFDNPHFEGEIPSGLQIMIITIVFSFYLFSVVVYVFIRVTKISNFVEDIKNSFSRVFD